MAGEKRNPRLITMFDICKIYPIWIPPCSIDPISLDATEESLIKSVEELADVDIKTSVSFEEACKALDKFHNNPTMVKK